MKSYIFISSLLALVACNNTPEKTNTPAADTTSTSPKDSADNASVETPDSTKSIIRNGLKIIYKEDLDKGLPDSLSRKVIFSEYDLNSDGVNEIFVGTQGSYFCGSGGCTILLLDNKGNLLNTFTVSGYPVGVEKEASNGWHNLVIRSGNKEHLVKYDGKKYPSNPSLQPEIDSKRSAEAEKVLNNPDLWVNF